MHSILRREKVWNSKLVTFFLGYYRISFGCWCIILSQFTSPLIKLFFKSFIHSISILTTGLCNYSVLSAGPCTRQMRVVYRTLFQWNCIHSMARGQIPPQYVPTRINSPDILSADLFASIMMLSDDPQYYNRVIDARGFFHYYIFVCALLPHNIIILCRNYYYGR